MAAFSQLEQYILELVNLARLDPAAMAARFAIDLNEGLPPGTISAESKSVLAMSDLLHDTAEYHSAWMVANNSFSTIGELGSNPGDRMAYAGFNDGEPFEWGETLTWQFHDANAQFNLSSVAYSFFRTSFLDPGNRALMLSEDFNEVGVNLMVALLGGQPDVQAHVLTADLAGSDEVFITGAHFDRYYFPDTIVVPPNGVAGTEVSADGASTSTGVAGGYRLAVAGTEHRVTLGGADITLFMDGGNAKLDLIGSNLIQSSHSLMVHAGVAAAHLVGLNDAHISTVEGSGLISLHGNGGNNHLTGNSASNYLYGEGGADVLEGARGDDFYFVDSSADQVIEHEGEGFDRVYASASYGLNDGASVEELRIASGLTFEDMDLSGNDHGQLLKGNWGMNRLEGRGGDDELYGERGEDILVGGAGRDLLRGGADADTFLYEAVSDSLAGETRDHIADWETDDRIDLSAIDANILLSDRQGFTFIGSGSVDRTVATGELKYYFVNGNTYLVGNVDGDDQADFQIEFAGHHVLTAANFVGLAGVRFTGTTGNNVLVGTAYDDVLRGGLGADRLTGGDGSDRFIYDSIHDSRPGTGRDVIEDWQWNDRIDVTNIDAALEDGLQNFTFVGLGSVDRVVASGELKYYHVMGNTYLVGSVDGDDEADFQIEFAGTHHFTADNFVGLAGARVTGNSIANTLVGTGGDDVLQGNGGRDTLYGRGGDDRFVYTSLDDSRPGGGRDLIVGWDEGDRIDISQIDADLELAGIQALRFVGLGSADRTIASGEMKYYHVNGNTYVVASVDGDDQADFQIEIAGTHYLTADNFVGLATNGGSVGTSGDDVLQGGSGRDVFYGGEGSDLFVYTRLDDSRPGEGRDLIADWDAGDRIDVSAIDADLGTIGNQSLRFVGAGTVDRVVASGDLKYYHVNGNTYLVASVDGDDQADFQIEIAGVHGLSADEFLL